MKKLLLITLFAVLSSCNYAYGQTVSPTPTVQVTQGFVDDANAAFRELITLRSANTALTKANDANALAVTALASANETLKADNADLRKLKCDTTTFLFFLVKIKRCK